LKDQGGEGCRLSGGTGGIDEKKCLSEVVGMRKNHWWNKLERGKIPVNRLNPGPRGKEKAWEKETQTR